jgi:hypothetical protein
MFMEFDNQKVNGQGGSKIHLNVFTQEDLQLVIQAELMLKMPHTTLILNIHGRNQILVKMNRCGQIFIIYFQQILPANGIRSNYPVW